MKIYKKYVWITLASIIYGAGISLFEDPNNLAPGGVSGLSIILNRITGVETGTLVFLLNIPLIITGSIRFGFRFFASTLYSIFATSFFMNIFINMEPATNDTLVASIMGGVLVAVSLKMIFYVEATTGGTDIVVRLLQCRYKDMKTGQLFLMIDMIIVALSILVFGKLDLAVYAGVSVVICSKILDWKYR